MEESILNSIKKQLGIVDNCKDFDDVIIMHINTVFNVLNQLGIGPDDGFSISDESTTWNEYINDTKDYEMVKTYIYLKVKIVFDPPLNSSILESMKQVINEYEWRLNVQAESKTKEVQK